MAGNLKQFMDDHYIADVRKGMQGLKGKPYALSCSHGGGGRVRDVMKRIFRRVGRLVGESVASRGYPSPSVLEECKSLGQRLVESVEQEQACGTGQGHLFKPTATWYNELCRLVKQCWTGWKEDNVTETIGQMTKEEFKRMIGAVVEATVEQKLIEILGDPDEGLGIREAVRDRLLRQRQAVAAGEQGLPIKDVVQQLGLE